MSDSPTTTPDVRTDAPSTDLTISRRGAMASLGALGLAALAPGACAQSGRGSGMAQASGLTAAQMGWNDRTGEYELPPLPYDYDALEPHIDAETMRLHHDKHHAGYVRGLNNALAKLAEIRAGRGDAGLIKHWSRELAFHGSGHLNHAIFWAVMAPPNRGGGGGGGGRPSGALAQAINRDFGSYDAFSTHFRAASGAVEGSGWGWLVYEPSADKLLVMQAEKHQNLTIWGVLPLMGIDVWEHAYYLRYQNRRGDYVREFMNVVNWDMVSKLYDGARA